MPKAVGGPSVPRAGCEAGGVPCPPVPSTGSYTCLSKLVGKSETSSRYNPSPAQAYRRRGPPAPRCFLQGRVGTQPISVLLAWGCPRAQLAPASRVPVRSRRWFGLARGSKKPPESLARLRGPLCMLTRSGRAGQEKGLFFLMSRYQPKDARKVEKQWSTQRTQIDIAILTGTPEVSSQSHPRVSQAHKGLVAGGVRPLQGHPFLTLKHFYNQLLLVV